MHSVNRFRASLGSGLVSLFTNAATELSLIFLPLFAQDVGASRFQVGAIVGVYGITYFGAVLFFSRLSDLLGRLSFIRLSLGLGAGSLALQLMVDSPTALMFVRALTGFSFGISAAVLFAYNFEAGGSTGAVAALGSLGYFAADMIAVFVGNYHLLFILSTVWCTLAFLMSWTLREAPRRTPAIGKPAVKVDVLQVARKNMWVYLPFFLRQASATMVWAVFPLFLQSLGATKSWIGIIYAINTGGQFVAMLFVERLRGSRLFLLGMIFSGAAFLFYGLSSSYVGIIPVQIVLAAAWSCIYVGALVLLLQNNTERGTSTGVLMSTLSAAGVIGPFLGGAAAELWGFPLLMFISSGVSFLAVGVFQIRKRFRGTLGEE